MRFRYDRIHGIGEELRLWGIWGCVLMAMLLTSCTPVDGKDAGQLLEQSISGIAEQKNFVFQGSAEVRINGAIVQSQSPIEGVVADNNRMYMRLGAASPRWSSSSGTERQQNGILYTKTNGVWTSTLPDVALPDGIFHNWNPLVKMEQLRGMKKTVVRNADLSDAETTVLDTVVDQDAATQMIVRELRERQAEIVSEARLAEFQQAYGLSASEAARMKQELELAAQTASAKMQAMAQTLRVGMNYRFWVDRVTQLPHRMRVEMRLQYRYQENENDETVAAEYEFQDYDKPVMIPQQ